MQSQLIMRIFSFLAFFFLRLFLSHFGFLGITVLWYRTRWVNRWVVDLSNFDIILVFRIKFLPVLKTLNNTNLCQYNQREFRYPVPYIHFLFA